MKKILIGVIVLASTLSFLASPTKAVEPDPRQKQIVDVRLFLESKKSPMSPYTELLLQQKHWKLLVAISAIESQYCKRKIAYNCFGIGGDSAYRKYKNIGDSILDANKLIEKWQKKGRWLTPEDMNGSYVVPKNPNWLKVVKQISKEMQAYEPSDTKIHK